MTSELQLIHGVAADVYIYCRFGGLDMPRSAIVEMAGSEEDADQALHIAETMLEQAQAILSTRESVESGERLARLLEES